MKKIMKVSNKSKVTFASVATVVLAIVILLSTIVLSNKSVDANAQMVEPTTVQSGTVDLNQLSTNPNDVNVSLQQKGTATGWRKTETFLIYPNASKGDDGLHFDVRLEFYFNYGSNIFAGGWISEMSNGYISDGFTQGREGMYISWQVDVSGEGSQEGDQRILTITMIKDNTQVQSRISQWKVDVAGKPYEFYVNSNVFYF